MQFALCGTKESGVYSMKRMVLCFLTLMLLLSSWNAFAVADSGKQAMDLVIIIDQSNSMKMKDDAGRWKGNDQLGYRMDAAAIMLSMCDMEDSRAALVLFNRNNTYFSREDGGDDLQFVDISQKELGNRLKMIEWLNGQRDHTAPGTDIGQAMSAAVNLFKKDESDREKVILLLTDGGHDLVKTKGSHARTTEDSKRDYENAVQWAADNGVRVYTIGLKASSGKSYDLYELQQTAVRTDGYFLQAEKAENLPEFFNQFYATEIQSAVISRKGELNPDLGENWYTVKIPIPNASVSEANIMVAHDKSKGNGKTVVLYQPSENGKSAKEMIPDRKKSICFDTDYFSVYKILSPAVGEWTLNYKSTDHADVDINIIFNYNVEPCISLDEGNIIGKTGAVASKVVFYTKDGKASGDKHLYAPASSYNLGGIEGQLTVTNEDNQVIATVPMEKSETDMQFSALLDFAEKKLESGVYTVEATMVGAGMNIHSAPATFTVENGAPQETEALWDLRASLTKVEIHDPRKDDYSLEYETTIDLTQYIDDPDADKLKYELVGEPQNVEASVNGSSLKLRTMNLPVDEVLTIKATDSDRNLPLSINVNVPIKVRNIRSEAMDSFYVKIDPINAGVNKNETVVLTAKLYNGDVPVKDTEWLNLTEVNLLCDDETVIPMTCENGIFKGTFTVSDVEHSYVFTAKATMSDFALRAEGSMSLTVGNVAPKLNKDAAALLPQIMYIDPFLWGQKDEPQTSVVLSDLLTDTSDDTLEFEAYVVPNEVMNTADETTDLLTAYADQLESLKLSEADGVVTLILLNETAGNRTVLLSAQDRDGVTVQYIYATTIISQKSEIIRLIMMALAALVAFVLLCIIFYWSIIRKRWSYKYGTINRYIGGALHQSVVMPKRGKQDRTLGEILRLGDLYDRNSDSYRIVHKEFAAKSKVRPLSGFAVRVMVVRVPKEMELVIDNRKITKAGSYTWSRTGTLIVRMDGYEAKFERKKPESRGGRGTAGAGASRRPNI